MINKRGFLLAEETLKVILAVIAIGLLAFLLFSLYNAGRDSENLELAKESIDFLEQEINAESKSVEIYNPEKWIILSWPYLNENEKPKTCDNLGWSSCICIIEDVSAGEKMISTLPFTKDIREKYLENSDEKGVCIQNTKGLTVVSDGAQRIIVIRSPLSLSINYESKIITEA